MLNKLTTEIRELIERSMANIEQSWDYTITVRYRIGCKESYISIHKDESGTSEEIEEDEH